MLKKAKDLVWLVLLLFVFILPISSFLSTRILVILFVLSLVFGDRKFNFHEFLKSSFDILIYLLLNAIGLLYSSDKILGFKTLETSFALLVLPLILIRMPKIDREQLNRIFHFVLYGTFSAGLICLVSASLKYLHNDHDPSVFFYYNFTDIISSHPTYLAYYSIFAITFGFYMLSFQEVQFSKIVFIGLILFCFIILLLTGGQTSFVSILLVFSFFILRWFLGDKTGNQKQTIAFIFLMMVTMFVVNLKQNSQVDDNLNDSWDRFAVWEAAIRANPNPFFGVGTGDYKMALNEYFNAHNLDEFAKNNLNSHNQFIQIYLSNGLLGVLALIVMLARPIYLAFKNNSPFGILVLFPFLIYGMTEVFLGRYQGVVFFAVLHQVFVSHYSLKQEFSLKEA